MTRDELKRVLKQLTPAHRAYLEDIAASLGISFPAFKGSYMLRWPVENLEAFAAVTPYTSAAEATRAADAWQVHA